MPEETTSRATVAESQETQAPPPAESHEPAASETVTEERRGPESSRIDLGDLSAEAYRKWQLSGKLPLEIEARPEPKKPENILEKLSDSELSHWNKTGQLPERLAGQTTETSKEKPAEATVESKEPEFVRLGEAITPEAHQAAVQTYEERMNKAWKEAGDHPQILKEAATVFPKLCGGNKQAANSLLAFLDSASAHMAHPADAMREFIRNAEFRGRIEKSGPNEIIAILSKFDREFKPARERRVPAPPTSISGKATGPIDEEASAAAKGDFAAYERAANAADFARSKGRR